MRAPSECAAAPPCHALVVEIPLNAFAESITTAVHLILNADAKLGQIVGLSLAISGAACAIAAAAGMVLGAVLAVTQFPGRRGVLVLLNTSLALPVKSPRRRSRAITPPAARSTRRAASVSFAFSWMPTIAQAVRWRALPALMTWNCMVRQTPGWRGWRPLSGLPRWFTVSRPV